MEKRIFEEQEIEQQAPYQPKREFDEAEVIIENESEIAESENTAFNEETLKPTRLWVRLLLIAFALFGIAVVAQSVQWVIESWQANQWIYLLFAIVCLLVSLIGIGTVIGEWRKLVRLRRHYYYQQQSRQFLPENPNTSGEMAVKFCQARAKSLPQTHTTRQSIARWQAQLDEGYNAQEVVGLFTRNVLQPLDQDAQKIISKSAAENAILVALSPLAVVDILMVAWRNIDLVNKLSRHYGMELGYISRLKLFKMVLTNVVFAGVSEMATEMGASLFSQNLAAKLSMRAGQGIAVGLLTARLGIQTMAFCRPICFHHEERPKLSAVKKELLGVVKTTLFTRTEKSKETVN